MFANANVGRLKVNYLVYEFGNVDSHIPSLLFVFKIVRLFKGKRFIGHKTCFSFLSTVYVGNSFPFDKC